MKSLLAAILIPLTPACLWVDGTTLNGRHVSVGGWNQAKVLRKAMDTPPHDVLLQALILSDESDDITDTELQAISNLLEGNSAAAIETLRRLEHQHPNRYSSAANLGTAYELHGDNRKALKWISEGIRRNPESHHGTEWLHVAILETKIAMEQQSDPLLENPIIPLPKHFDRSTRMEIAGQTRTISEIDEALRYQLQERMTLVKPSDPVVADLLFTYARVIAHTSNLEEALGVLALSREYGYPQLQQLASLEEEYRRMIMIRRVKSYAMIAAGVIAVLCLLVWMSRKKWFFISRKSYLEHQQHSQQE
ncbi:hypothetical protein JIN77_12915 [Verrucomicrobiaceae bacterium R5-34]|nr:hypothetical protein [Verrucomicrobiaceae bacterium R5-34]